MRLKSQQTMATAIEQLVIDSQSRFLEMKSLQPYSTKDEYLYAMKEDLADWLSNMYPNWQPITADNFLECLENGALLCHHANNVNDAARKVSSSSRLTNCKYRLDARPQTFNARDNVSQFIKWSRNIAGVREVLMFESDDLILRKNEKNFILCLLEIARYGAKFGISVPAIIRLEQEIEREIERDQQTEKISFTELKFLQREEENNDDEKPDNQFDSTNNNDNNDDDGENQKNQFDSTNNNNNNDSDNQINTTSLSNSNGANLLQEHISQFSNNNNNNNSKQRHGSEESYDSTTSSEVPTAIVTTNEGSQFNRTVEEKPKPIVPPASSSQLHKTVVKITNSCCCSQRFPVIRIGEGKYRIGENGTIIFIRILRNHVMVRVGGGWDTLENYLNKHDPCRRSGHHRNEHHHHNHNHSDIPILAIPNSNISPSVQKNTPFGKSVTIKTEEFPLPKPSIHDTNLVDAQLVITRGADGRHHIGQITYKSEEDTLNQPSVCPQHHHHHANSSPPPPPKTKTVRNTGRMTPTSFFSKQSSPSTDQDYSSLTETTTRSKPSSSSSLDSKEESIEQPMKQLDLTITENRPIRHYSPVNKSQTQPIVQINNHAIKSSNQNINDKKSAFTESVIGNIDDCIHPTPINVEHDFDINDIADVMNINKKENSDENTANMDNDSLDGSEDVLEVKKKPPSPSTTKKSGGYTSAFYIAQKQKFQQEQIANRKRPPISSNLNRYSSRSTTLSTVSGATKQRRKPMIVTQRSQSSDIIEKLNDLSKLDRDSGFDEQDFHRERLQSNGDDNSSISSIKSARSSTARSMNFEIRENKSYELRMKKLDSKKNPTEKDSSSLKINRNITSTSRRGSELVLATSSTTNKYRKNSQPIINTKQQNENVNF